jgi:predicted porin
MRGLLWSSASAAAMFLGCAGVADAADIGTMPTKAPVAAEAPPPATCTSIQDFFLTGCLLSWYGVRFYGTIDVGYGYQTHGAPFNPFFVTGASYFLQKMNRSPMWGLAPSGLSQSNVGVQIKEPLAPGWSFIAELQSGFDPYSLEFANSPHSEFKNINVPVNQQSTNGDSSRGGQFYNSLGFAGISSDTYGTLTFFRQNSLTLDGVLAYDPMGGSYAFSPIGFSGVVAGGGDTENAKYSTSAKYRVNIGDFRLAALGQFGGYDLSNGSKGAVEGQLGGDIRNLGPGILSLDAIVDYNKDAVNLSLAGAPTNAQGVPIGTMLPQILTATISNNTSVMALGKYSVDKWKLYAGYEWMQFAPPSDPFTIAGSGFTDIAGDFVCLGCNAFGTNINSTAYSASAGFKDKILQVAWAGARYSITDSVDVVGAYYHYDQNNFAASAANLAACNISATNKNYCHGTMDAASAMIDWRFAPKWDTYIGTFFSQMNGGLDNGFLARNNLATTAGVRFRW